MRKLVVGVDEAGYGPNLGPLCIGASIWSMRSDQAWTSLVEPLSRKFRVEFQDREKYSSIPLGDSKKLYRSGGSRSPLTAGVLGLLSMTGQLRLSLPETLLQVRLGPETSDQATWYGEDCMSEDLFFRTEERFEPPVLEQAAELLASLEIELYGLYVYCLDEPEFNRRLERLGNKSTLLTEATFEIIREVLVRQACDNSQLLGYDQLEILCDKHGGRNRYHSPLCHAFPESWFEIVEESAAISSYRASIFGVDSRWSFRAKGDNIVPCSAASMIANGCASCK